MLPMLPTAGLITLIVAALLFLILWKIIQWDAWLSALIAVVVAVALGAMLYFWVFPKFSGLFTDTPKSEPPAGCSQSPFPTYEPPVGFYWIWSQDQCAWIPQAFPVIPLDTFTPIVPPNAAPAPVFTDSLKYDKTDCDPANFAACIPPQQEAWYQQDTTNRLRFPAEYIQRVQANEIEPSIAIQAIQSMANGWALTYANWTQHSVDPVLPELIWNPRNSCTFVPDTAFPLLGEPRITRAWDFLIAVVQPHAPSNDPAVVTKIVCSSSDNWAVRIH